MMPIYRGKDGWNVFVGAKRVNFDRIIRGRDWNKNLFRRGDYDNILSLLHANAMGRFCLSSSDQ